MNRKDLARSIGAMTGNSMRVAEEFIEAFGMVITSQMKEGNSVSIAGFGAFESEKKPEKAQKINGKMYLVPERVSPKFRFFKTTKDKINGKGE